jgi:tRNA threonylcarbamoyladenosine biosynthesis protein TsaE
MSTARAETFLTHSPAETEALAERLAHGLPGGTLLLLSGELGSGKTVFVRGLLRGLGGAPEAVTSPTYVLLHRYAGARTLYHIDAYRLRGGADEYEAAGLRECLDDAQALVAVEWPERAGDMAWPAPRVEIEIEHAGPEDRRIVVRRVAV